MKKLIVILNLLLVSATALYAQANNEYAIYDTIVKMSEQAKPIRNTQLRTLKNFNFKDQKEYDWNAKDTLNSEWKQFFKGIDLSTIQPGQLDSAFLVIHPEAKYPDWAMSLSPIVISPDGTKAICGAHVQQGGETMYLFEKKNNKWILRRRYVMNVE